MLVDQASPQAEHAFAGRVLREDFGVPVTLMSSFFINISEAKELPVDWRQAVQ